MCSQVPQLPWMSSCKWIGEPDQLDDVPLWWCTTNFFLILTRLIENWMHTYVDWLVLIDSDWCWLMLIDSMFICVFPFSFAEQHWIPVANLSISRCDESDVAWQCHYFVCRFFPTLIRLPCKELIFLWTAGQPAFSYVCLQNFAQGMTNDHCSGNPKCENSLWISWFSRDILGTLSEKRDCVGKFPICS